MSKISVFIFMAIIIIIITVLSFCKRLLKLLLLKAGQKIDSKIDREIAKKEKELPIPTVNTDPNQDIREEPGLSEAEIIEKLRVLKKIQRANKITGWIFIVSFFGFAALLAGQSMSIGEFFLRYILPVGTAFLLRVRVRVMTDKPMKELKSLMGAAVTLPILREVFEVKTYRPHSHIGRDIVDSTGLIARTDLISGSDCFEGSYKGINILCSDLWLGHEESRTDSDGNRTTKTVTDFLGQWMVCDFGKELAAAVRLKERERVIGRVRDIGKSDIETENVAFNKKFYIFTEDEHTAFYLLTPHFMELLVAADTKAHSSSLFCFKDGKVHIALDSERDAFELGNVNPDQLDDLRQRFWEDIQYMTDIIDILLLNDRLFQS